jgi:ribosomal protein S7
MELKKKTNKNFILYNKFIGLITKKGKKSTSVKIVHNALFKVSVQINIPIQIIFIQIFIKLNSFVETKKVNIKQTSYIVPFGITFERRCYLIAKWLLSSLERNRQKISSSEKLSIEILNLLQNETLSKAYVTKKQTIKESSGNRSNIHYRW